MDRTRESKPPVNPLLGWVVAPARWLSYQVRNWPPLAAAMGQTLPLAIFAALFTLPLLWLMDWVWRSQTGEPLLAALWPFALLAFFFTMLCAFGPYAYFMSLLRTYRENRAQLKVALEEAEQANRMKSAFLANTSHEIRTPLNGVLGMAEMLGRADLPAEQREQVALLREAGRALSTLLNDILDLSKVEAGRMSISPEPVDLEALVDSTVALWRPRADAKGLTLDLTWGESAPRWVICDADRVRQCVHNLLSNAIKFTDEGAVSANVSARRAQDGGLVVSIAVADTGSGFDEAARTALFQPFEQVGAGGSGGAGLGLAITQRLAHLMGGDVTVASAPGEGSTFTFTFAGRAAKAPRPGRQAAANPDLPRLDILVVDDTETNLTVARLLLEAQGHTVTPARGGEEALAQMAAQRFDVVMLDIHMPDPDGPETLRRLRRLGPPASETPVIALTADAMSGDRERFLHLGMDGYATKPIAISTLMGEVSRVMKTAALKEARRSASSS